MKRYICAICGYVYEEAKGVPGAGIGPGTLWETLPQGWVCPVCGAPKSAFHPEEAVTVPVAAAPAGDGQDAPDGPSAAELSAVCSNLAKGCEKQYLPREAELYARLAAYYKAHTPPPPDGTAHALAARIKDDLDALYPSAWAQAKQQADRGALRVLTWSEKVTRMLDALLARYQSEGGAFIEGTNVYVCDICGFIYIGDEPPAVCPVCKVPSLKILQVERG